MIVTFHTTLDPTFQVATATEYMLRENGSFDMHTVKLFILNGTVEQVTYGPYTNVPHNAAHGSYQAFFDYGD